MKQLFEAFPLLKKKRFYLLLMLLVLCAYLTGLLYLSEPTAQPSSFETDREDVEKALALTEQKLSACTEEERPSLLQEKAFYESALKLRLSPWSSYFASEGLSAYARLLCEGDGAKAEELEQILLRRDKKGLLAFYEKYPQPFPLDERLLMAEDAPQNSGRDALLYDVTLLEDSLETGKDRYFGTDSPLSASDRNLLESLLHHKERLLSAGEENPVPANRETLLLSERFIACLAAVLLTACMGYGKAQSEKGNALLWFSVPLLSCVFLCGTALAVTTLIHAPGTAEPVPLQWGFSLPFYPALLLRLLCRVAGSLPTFYFCFFLRSKKGRDRAWRLLALLPPLRFLLQSVSDMLFRTAAGILTFGDLGACLFPSLSAYSLRPASPWAGVLLWLAALALCLVPFWRKGQKLTAKKQKVSIENHSEL